jgi:glucosyl-3-phosphoglycerate synthase
MGPRYSTRLFRKVLVPVLHEGDPEPAISAALMITDASNVVLVGVVGILDEESLSAAALPAREVRGRLHDLGRRKHVRSLERIRVSHRPWSELLQIVDAEQPDLLILAASQLARLNATTPEALRYPPCDTIIAYGLLVDRPADVMCALRGGPYAELTLRLGLAIARTSQARLTALHLAPAPMPPVAEPAFKGVDRVLRNLPSVARKYIETDSPAEGILKAANDCDLLVLGASARSEDAVISVGPVAENVLQERSKGVLVVKSSRPIHADMDSESVGQNAISILVDKWFAGNTYHAAEFEDLDNLVELKRRQGLSISLALPALNEEVTVGRVIETIRDALMRSVPLVDELVLIDSASTDQTREIAAGLDVPVHVHQQVLPELGARAGKGEALWKSLYVTSGDLVLWIDTDIVNIHPRFVYGLLGPLIRQPEIQFVKGFYRRPLKVEGRMQAGGGGRVTELTARPLLNLFFPELSGIIQPLSGEYGGRRSALEKMPFSSGYGVEIGLLIDMFEKFGLDAIAQVDLQERIHHNQPLESLSRMSFAIIQTVIRRIEQRYGFKLLEDVNKTMKLIRYGRQRLLLEVSEIAELERPPMAELSEYRARSAGRT